MENATLTVDRSTSNMKFLLVLSFLTLSAANLLNYHHSYSHGGGNHYNHPSYSKPLTYNHIEYQAPRPQPQPPIYSGPLCGTLNGSWKTFSNVHHFKEEIRRGFAWTFYGNGPCPSEPKACPDSDKPVCAMYNRELRTFANPLALEVEKFITGENWVKILTGVCPNIPKPVITTTTPAPTPYRPCHHGPVCGILNGVWKTFRNIIEFNEEVRKGHGWSFYGNGPCPNPEVCAQFENEFKTFPSALALEVEKFMTGKNWVIVYSGVCNTTTTVSPDTTTTPATPTTPVPPSSIDNISDEPETTTPTSSPTPSSSIEPETSTAYYRTRKPYNTSSESVRIQQYNNYHGAYVEGAYNYYPKIYDKSGKSH